VLLVAACSSPPTGPASVVVHDPMGAPVAGAPVLLHYADGALAERTATAADGTATIDIEDGGAVTVATGVLATIADVERGDTLRFGLGTPQATVRMTVLLPTFPPPAQYAVTGPGFTDDNVGWEVPRVPISMVGAPATGDVLAQAASAGGSRFLIARAQPFVDGGTLDLSGLAWGAPTDASCAVRGLPADADDADLSRSATQGGVPFDEGFDGHALGGAIVDCGPVALGDGSQTRVTIFRPRGAGVAADVETVTVTDPATTVDVASMILPRWTGPVAFDGRTFAWSTDGSGSAAPIAVRLQVPTTNGAWTVIVAGDRTSFALPDVPPDLAPTVDAAHPSGTIIGSQTEGYAAYRGHAFVADLGHDQLGDPAAPFETLAAP
jgi:hypothetical protein